MNQKMFKNQVEEISTSVNTAKGATSNNATMQLAASETREKLSAKVKTPREIWRSFESVNAMQLAAKVVSRSSVNYSFEKAKEITKGFSLVLTTSETETKHFATVGTKVIFYKEIIPETVDNVLRSFESCKLYFDAMRIQANKQEREAQRNEREVKAISAVKQENLLKAAALALGVSVDDLLAMQQSK